MNCPKCGAVTKVRGSIDYSDKPPVRRRGRICRVCDHRFVTYELITTQAYIDRGISNFRDRQAGRQKP